MSISLLVCLFFYWNYVNIGISPVQDEIYSWKFLETFPGFIWTISKLYWISCMSFSLLVGSHPYWNYVNIGISPVLDKIYFLNFWRHSLDISGLFSNYSVILVCLPICLSVSYISPNWSFLGVNFWDLWSCFSPESIILI